MSRREGLTKKEMAFCEAYALQNESATQAYLQAYNCEYNTAKGQGYKMLRKPHIAAYIETLQKEAFAAACVSAEKVGLKLAEIAFSKKGDEYYTATSQLKALDLLQKQLGLQHQHIDANIESEINITIEE